MTFTMNIKEEICNIDLPRPEVFSELYAIIRYGSNISDKIMFINENASVARRIFKDIKSYFNISCHIIIRDQKRFRMKKIYILEINDNVDNILEDLYIKKGNKDIKVNKNYLNTHEEMIAFVRGCFLVCGTISDPKKGSYHLEYVFDKEEDALFFNDLLHEMKFMSKIIKRKGKYVVYLKNSEEISDMIRMFEASNALFYFEDIRIYRDHKNMVNRLNNCDIANKKKSTNTGLKQIEIINYLKENDLIDLLDEKTKIVLDYRLRYPEASFNELADIINNECNMNVSKSFINHHFIKMKKLLENHVNNK